MTDNNTQVAVIGAGPGGYAAAFLAADMGLQKTLITALAPMTDTYKDITSLLNLDR